MKTTTTAQVKKAISKAFPFFHISVKANKYDMTATAFEVVVLGSDGNFFCPLNKVRVLADAFGVNTTASRLSDSAIAVRDQAQKIGDALGVKINFSFDSDLQAMFKAMIVRAHLDEECFS